MLKIDNGKLYRVNKTVASKAFNAGKPVYLLPCKTRLDNMWLSPNRVTLDGINTMGTDDGFNTVVARYGFENVVTCYTYYNCNNELGRYPAYYLERG